MSSIDIKAKVSGLTVTGKPLVPDEIKATVIPGGAIDANKVVTGRLAVSVPVSVVVIRPKGPASSVQLPGTHFVETSLEQLAVKPSAVAMLRGLNLGAVILEDLRVWDLPKDVLAALSERPDGVSFPIVSRWTNLREGDAR